MAEKKKESNHQAIQSAERTSTEQQNNLKKLEQQKIQLEKKLKRTLFNRKKITNKLNEVTTIISNINKNAYTLEDAIKDRNQAFINIYNVGKKDTEQLKQEKMSIKTNNALEGYTKTDIKTNKISFIQKVKGWFRKKSQETTYISFFDETDGPENLNEEKKNTAASTNAGYSNKGLFKKNDIIYETLPPNQQTAKKAAKDPKVKAAAKGSPNNAYGHIPGKAPKKTNSINSQHGQIPGRFNPDSPNYAYGNIPGKASKKNDITYETLPPNQQTAKKASEDPEVKKIAEAIKNPKISKTKKITKRLNKLVKKATGRG